MVSELESQLLEAAGYLIAALALRHVVRWYCDRLLEVGLTRAQVLWVREQRRKGRRL